MISIKPSRVRAEEHDESLVNQLNQKSVEITDLNAQLQEKLIQELLGYVRDTCPDIHKPSKKLVAGTPINKKKTVRGKPVTNIVGQSLQDNTKMIGSGRFQVEPKKKNNSKSKSVKKAKKKEEWKPTGKVFTKIGYNWRPTGRTFTLVGNACPLTRITATNKVPLREPIPLEVVQIVLWYLDSGCSKHMTGDRSQLTNFVHKFLGTVKFGNDQIAKIIGYDDYQTWNITISKVYYV
ncbi:hypothetical protein Tco_1530461 [Tanacetum coccineum]